MLTADQKNQIDAIFRAALAEVRKQFPRVPFPAATVEAFAWKRFLKACTLERIEDPRFPTDAPTFARYLLLDEVLMFEQAKKLRKRSRK